MNEITNIHLGRQAFTIAVDAYKALQDYLHDIKHQVGSKSADVVEEVEVRMAELLTERGVTGDKVILLDDVAYLKEQLGEPGDFKEEDAGADAPINTAQKRLFRDTEHGMLAGVCAGIANYFGTDPLYIRLILVLFVLLGGSGIILYLILWLLVPEARTNSDRLQMHGKAITVDSLKEVVERADVQGAARRAHTTVSKGVHGALKVSLVLIGLPLAIAGTAMLIGLMALTTYLMIHGGQVNNQLIFPIGVREWLFAACGLVVAGIVALLLLLSGTAMMRRKWVIPGWVTAALVALFVVAGGVGTALGFDAVPRIKNRVDTIINTQPMPKDCRTTPFNYCTDRDAYKSEQTLVMPPHPPHPPKPEFDPRSL